MSVVMFANPIDVNERLRARHFWALEVPKEFFECVLAELNHFMPPAAVFGELSRRYLACIIAEL